MREIDINRLVDKYDNLYENISNNIIIVGGINKLYIKYKYDQLDLSKVKCYQIYYWYQEGESIKNHILPNSLETLSCYCSKITSFTDVQLPNSLIDLYCNNNQLISLPNLPNSLKYLHCSNNQLTSLPDLPNSLESLYCHNNQLALIPELPNPLKYLYCYNNQLTSFTSVQIPYLLEILKCSHNRLTSLPDFSHIDHALELSFIQDLPISFIPYNKNIKLCDREDNKIIIEGYPHNPITNQNELDQYMDFIFHKMNRIKSARK